MNNNSIHSNDPSQDLKSQTKTMISEKAEPSINILSKLNSIANENFHQIIPLKVCEICYKPNDLLICEICKSGFHQKCLGTAFLPEHFICLYCKQHFTKDEIATIMNQIFNQNQIQRKVLMDSQKVYKEYDQNKYKNKFPLNHYKNRTKIIELDEEYSSKNSSIKNTKLKKQKIHKNKIINVSTLNSGGTENDNSPEKKDQKSENIDASEKPQNKKKRKHPINSLDDDNSKIENKIKNSKNKKQKESSKEKLIDSNSNIKQNDKRPKSHTENKNSKDKEIKLETISKKNKKKDFSCNEIEKDLLLSLAHTDPQYKSDSLLHLMPKLFLT